MLVRVRLHLLRRKRSWRPPLLVAWPSISMSSNAPLARTGPTWAPRLLLLQPGSLPSRHMSHRRATCTAGPCSCCRSTSTTCRCTGSCIAAAAARDRRRPPPNERADAQQTAAAASVRCMRIGRCCVLPCGGTAAAAASSFGYRPFKCHLNFRLFCLCCAG